MASSLNELRNLPAEEPRVGAQLQKLIDRGVGLADAPWPKASVGCPSGLPRVRSLAATANWGSATAGPSQAAAAVLVEGHTCEALAVRGAGAVPSSCDVEEVTVCGSGSRGAREGELRPHGRRTDLAKRPGVKTRKSLSLSDALRVLAKDKYSESARRSSDARLKWWRSKTEAHGGVPFPLTIEKLRKGAALLKMMGFRSASQYLYTMKKGHVLRGYPWRQRLTAELKDCIRSCERGIGPAVQAQPLLLTPSALATAPEPVALRSGMNAILVGVWWLLREAELAALRRCDFEWCRGAGCGSMQLNLAVSKADASAKGVKRTLACACPSVLCPVVAAQAVLRATAGQSSDAFAVVNLRGQPATKAEVVAGIRAVAAATKSPGPITGHSLRVSGAQRLALAGVSEARITTFGRWSSAAFKLYVREAVLGVKGGDLSKVVEQNLTEAAQESVIQELTSEAHGLGAEACADFASEMAANPLAELTRVDVEAKWRAFAASLADEVRAAAARPLPRFCLSEQGVVHEITSCRYTRCGWHWAKAECRTDDSLTVNCRKCSGRSIRWG